MAYTQLVAPNTATQDGLGWCLRFTQTVFGATPRYNSAREAWDYQSGRHFGVEPPLGIAVPIWFDHWGNYGSPPRWDNWGHVAVRLANGNVLTSPFTIPFGQQVFPSIQAMMNGLGGGARYLGWSEFMNGKRIVEPTSTHPDPETPEEEDEEMANTGIAYTGEGLPSGVMRCAIVNTTSGYFGMYDTRGSSNALADAFRTGSYAIVDKSVFEAIQRQCSEVRTGA